jgi:hypothetical protein
MMSDVHPISLGPFLFEVPFPQVSFVLGFTANVSAAVGI